MAQRRERSRSYFLPGAGKDRVVVGTVRAAPALMEEKGEEGRREEEHEKEDSNNNAPLISFSIPSLSSIPSSFFLFFPALPFLPSP